MKKLKILIIGLCFLGCFSCNEFLTQEPETVVTNINYWKTEQDVQSAVYGMHLKFREVFGNVQMIYRDRGLPFDKLGSNWTKISNNDFSDEGIDSPLFVWANEYQVIACANSVIDNIYRAGLSDERHNLYLGQALTVRAYSYFCLIRFFGDVPLIKKAEDTGEKGRDSWTDVAEFIINDLKEAARISPSLNELKDASGTAITLKQIASRQTANAILAHVYAWKANLNHEPELLKEGIQAADAVINSGDYDLVFNPEEVCERVMHGNSIEGIFEICYRSPNDLKTSGSYIAGFCQRWPVQSLTTPETKRTPNILNTTVMEFYPDITDQRRDAYFYKLDSMAQFPASKTQGAAYIRKWRHSINWQDGTMVGRIRYYEENEVLIRLADIILLRAEMKAQSGDSEGAMTDLDRIRERAGAKKYTASEGDLEKAIARERERELFLEGICTRYFDIVRNGTFREKLRGKFKTLSDDDVKKGALYLPVGSYSARFDPSIVQTPYWSNEFPL